MGVRAKEGKKHCNDIKLNSLQRYLFSVCADCRAEARANRFNDESAYVAWQ